MALGTAVEGLPVGEFLFPAVISTAAWAAGAALRARINAAVAAEGRARRAEEDQERRGRRLVTENVKDFQPLARLASERGEPAPLVLFTSSRRFPRSRRNPGPLLDALRRWRSQSAADHAGPIAWLD